ncbi:MAG: trypsin-like serine protease [Roseibium sp.]
MMNRPIQEKVSPILAVLSVLWCALAFSSNAHASDLEVIDSTDDPWRSIGRVNVAGYRSTSMCTGTLIAPTIVLTAAHCLFNKRTLRRFQTEDVLFIAGVRREKYSARLEVECALTADGYTPNQKPKLSDVHKDVGILILKEPAALPPVPALAPKDAAVLNRETRFQSVGYRRSRRLLPTVVPACKVIKTIEDSWVTNCSSESGASGGPLLVKTEDGLRVAGVMSAKIDDTRSAIVPFFEWQDLLASATCSSPNRAQQPSLRSSLEDSN